MPDDWENNNGTDPNSDDGGGDFDDDGLTNAQEQEYSTYPWNAYSDADTKNDGEDGWALDKDMEPPRLPDASYVVIELGNGITQVVDMNNKGELLVIKGSGSSTEVGVWKAGVFTALPTKTGSSEEHEYIGDIVWSSLNDSGVVVGSRNENLDEDGDLEWFDKHVVYKTTIAGAQPITVNNPPIPSATPANWYPPTAAYHNLPLVDASNNIFAIFHGEDGYGPVKIGETLTHLAGFRASGASSDPDHEFAFFEGVNSAGILIGAMGSGYGGIFDGATTLALNDLGGSNSTAHAISDGSEPFVTGESNGTFTIWQKKGGTWQKVYNGAEKGSQISGYPIGVNARGELVGEFTGPEGTSGTIVRNGKVVDASKFPEGYTFSAATAAGHRRITNDGLAVVMGSEGGGMARSSGGSSDTLEELVPVEVAPNVLRVNSDFDEQKIDTATTFAKPDSGDDDLTAEKGPKMGKVIVDDLYKGFWGLWQGEYNNNPTSIKFANRDITQREQEYIVQQAWSTFSGVPTLGYLLGILAQSPLKDEIAGADPFSTVAGLTADITSYPDRWRWVDDGANGIWSNWTGVSTGVRTGMVNDSLETRAATFSIFYQNGSPFFPIIW